MLELNFGYLVRCACATPRGLFDSWAWENGEEYSGKARSEETAETEKEAGKGL